MEKKHRSPSFPQMGLGEAIERAAVLYKAIGIHMTSREVVAKGLGYSGVSGPSATLMGTLSRYGLIEGRGDEIRISNIAMAILRPHSEQEKNEAIRTAARSPELFQELGEKFPGSTPGNELLRNYLIRRGFSEQSADIAILAYKETLEFAGQSSERYDSASESEKEADAMDRQHTTQEPKKPAPPPSMPQEGEVVATYGNKDRGFVFIKATHGLSAKEAMAMAKRAIQSFEDQEKELKQWAKDEDI
jgi:hypothetical protein